ncbi:hypothetical protein Ahy_B05g078470 [Arachis hypogaea]|uniref:Uncharacterized protein n=1 Tax=Arachis hypogaea TaxID=3818 RepID=A0A444Z770_ARAHY|nr:hypothetical protein Ahy_B05g078470 [Arachis hypogaea]
MLKISKVTSIHSRNRFARICVEVDLSKQLVPRILVFRHVLNIKYEENMATDQIYAWKLQQPPHTTMNPTLPWMKTKGVDLSQQRKRESGSAKL